MVREYNRPPPPPQTYKSRPFSHSDTLSCYFDEEEDDEDKRGQVLGRMRLLMRKKINCHPSHHDGHHPSGSGNNNHAMNNEGSDTEACPYNHRHNSYNPNLTDNEASCNSTTPNPTEAPPPPPTYTPELRWIRGGHRAHLAEPADEASEIPATV